MIQDVPAIYVLSPSQIKFISHSFYTYYHQTKTKKKDYNTSTLSNHNAIIPLFIYSKYIFILLSQTSIQWQMEGSKNELIIGWREKVPPCLSKSAIGSCGLCAWQSAIPHLREDCYVVLYVYVQVYVSHGI